MEPSQLVRNGGRVPHVLRGLHLRVIGGEPLALIFLLKVLNVSQQLPRHRRPVGLEPDFPGGLLHPDLGKHPHVPASTAVTAPA